MVTVTFKIKSLPLIHKRLWHYITATVQYFLYLPKLLNVKLFLAILQRCLVYFSQLSIIVLCQGKLQFGKVNFPGSFLWHPFQTYQSLFVCAYVCAYIHIYMHTKWQYGSSILVTPSWATKIACSCLSSGLLTWFYRCFGFLVLFYKVHGS